MFYVHVFGCVCAVCMPACILTLISFDSVKAVTLVKMQCSNICFRLLFIDNNAGNCQTSRVFDSKQFQTYCLG